MDLNTTENTVEFDQLAVHLAEHLKSLVLLGAAEFRKTIAHMQQILPFNIRAHKTDQIIQINIEEVTPVNNPMSLPNLVHANSRIRLNDSSDGPLPKNVPEAYERILDRVPSDEQGNVKIILRIIVGARRPLTVQEMAMALGVATTPCAETAMEAGLSPNGLDKKIRQLCGLFVFIKESKIYLIHQTAREFLISEQHRSAITHWYLEQRETEIQMTEICVKYLLMNDLVSNDDESVRSLLDYSAENWADHFRDVLCPEAELVDWVWKLYDVRTKRFRLWFPKFWTVAMPYRRDPKMKALHLAAFNGHLEILCRVYVNRTDAINLVDELGMTALQWACERGHLEISQVLLEKRAHVNGQGGYYSNALQAASHEGHLEIVHRLLDKGADVNAQGGEYVNAQGGEYGNALQAAAAGGYLEVVLLLLEKGADVHAQGSYGNALQAASHEGHLEIVHRLLDKGADVHAQGSYGNALQAAAEGGYLEVVLLLLEKGAGVNAQGGHHGNALQAAAYKGLLKIFQLLLEKGADVHAQGGLYDNALQAATRRRHLKVVHRLLGNGGDVSAL